MASFPYDRRAFMAHLSSLGLGTTLLPGVLWAKIADGAEITLETIKCAEEIAGVSFADEERERMLNGIRGQEARFRALREVSLPNDVAPAIRFDPVPPGTRIAEGTRGDRRRFIRSAARLREVPSSSEEIAFLPVAELSELIRRRRITSVRLTEIYLERIARHDPQLHAVVTLLPERAMRHARAADAEISRGRWRGPLHGIPWGAKDLLAVGGHPTTWGTAPFRDQVIDENATVVKRLDEAGAVLLAKLTLGELAQGDRWFGGMTRNPWNLEQGSSGSSAGSAASVSAGLVAFAIGSETLGSISSPATRTGATGLRPTFGRVPRTGAMALSWSMDKLGPLCRSVEDCALVLDVIHGADGEDPTARDVSFEWNARADVRALRVGWFRSGFERDYPQRAFDEASIAMIRGLGVDLIDVELPDFPYNAMRIILTAEASAAFDEFTRTGRAAEMAQQDENAWPTTFRVARFIPAVEYINANRVRSLAMRAWAELFSRVDVIVAPTSHAQLTATNLTGHPAVILPNGFRPDGTPVSISFLGGLYEEAKLLAVADAYQRASGFHVRRPGLGGEG